MMKPLNKSAIITGAAKRIGARIAKALGNEGWFVYLHYNSSSREAKKVLHEIKSNGGNGQLIKMDLSHPDCGEQIINQIDCTGPPVELLINNAAKFEYDDISNINSVSMDQHFFANVRGPMLLSKAFFELITKGQQGCVINILDNKIFALNPDYLSYTISKAALQCATETLAMAMAPHVRVNGIAPGITLESGGQGDISFQKGQKMSPIGKVSSVEDIIKAVFFIVNTTSINGHIITIDGGQKLQKLDRDVAFL